jgi:hypothetical protein
MAYDISQKLDEQSKKLRQIAASTGLSVGSGGFKYYGAVAVTNVKFTALIPQEGTVFTSFKVNGVEQLTNRGMSGITFAQGAFLSGGGIITDFTISSGSVIAYY